MNIASNIDSHSMCEWGVRMELTRRSIYLDNTEWTAGGREKSCEVTVHHDGTRGGFRRAWGIARRLIASNQSRPALIHGTESMGITVDVFGTPSYIYTGRGSIEHVDGPATPPIPQLHTGPPLALPSSQRADS